MSDRDQQLKDAGWEPVVPTGHGSLHRLDMALERWNALMQDDDLPLTESEIKVGWHFCSAYDGLLIGPGMEENDNCGC